MKKLLQVIFSIISVVGLVGMCAVDTEGDINIAIAILSCSVFLAGIISLTMITNFDPIKYIFFATILVIAAFLYDKLHIDNESFIRCNNLRIKLGGYRKLFEGYLNGVE